MRNRLAFLAVIPSLLCPSPPLAAQGPGSAQEEIVLTVLFDNFSADDRLGLGWGFSALLETPGHTVLFDAGADGETLLENMRLLGKDPRTIEAVIISHAHGDHTGGLSALAELGTRPRLYLLSAFPSPMREEAARAFEVVEASPGQEIVPGIRVTGQVGTTIPEQALTMETRDGIVVLTGCAHPGVVAMTEAARRVTDQPVFTVMGGFHLGDSSAEELRGVVEAFRRLGIERAGPTHCSGPQAMDLFRDAYGEDFIPMGAGRVLRFEK